MRRRLCGLPGSFYPFKSIFILLECRFTPPPTATVRCQLIELCIIDFQLDRLSPLITGQGSGFAPNSGWSGKKAHHAYGYYFVL
jgi:hypothetical protein